MHTFKTLSHRISVVAALTMFAGCSGGSSQMAPYPFVHAPVTLPEMGARRGGDDGRTVKPLIFFSEATSGSGSGTVDIYHQAKPHKAFGQITAGLNRPTGLATDVAGNLYVANDSSSENVQVYAAPYAKGPTLTLNNAGYIPQRVAVSSAGVVAVSDYCANSSCSSEYSVVFFAKNSTTPCTAVPIPTPDIGDALAFDHQGNIFIGGQAASFKGFLGEIKGGCKAKRMKPLTTTNTIGEIYAIQIDKANDIAILDPSGKYIYTYSHPRKGSLGSPISTTNLDGSEPTFAFTFLASGASIWTVSEGVSYEYDYPAGGMPKASINESKAVDVAVTPVLVP